MNDEQGVKAKDWVAIILAIGIALAVNAIVFAVLYDAIAHPEQAGLSENATQILTAAFGGILGVLGAYVGYRAGAAQQNRFDAALGGLATAPTAPTAPTNGAVDRDDPDANFPHDSSAAEAATEEANETHQRL